jgi:uncharacterized membrane protein
LNVGGWWSRRPVIGRWTLKEAVQGKPIAHPSHPLFIHFPTALLPFAFVLDVVSRFHADLTVTRAAFYCIAFGLLMAIGAIITGLVDYLPMVGGSRKKKLGTYHLLAELPAMALFGVSLALRAADFDAERTGVVAMALAGAGVLGITVGNYFGGELVYKQGMRVSVDL